MLLPWICLFGVFISHSGASVSLVTDGGMTSFQDDTDVILICTISPYNNVMTWLVDNDPYANCFLGSCGPSSNKPYTFIFNFDESNGIFRLTIKSVNSTHAGLIFACDDGNERKTITFDVTTGVGKSGTSDELCSTMDGDCIGLIIGCIIALFWLIGLIGFCCCCNADMSEKDNCISCKIWLLCIPILGVIVMIYMYLDCKRCSNKTGQLQETDEFYVSKTEGKSATVCWKTCNGEQQDKKYILKFSKVEQPKEIPDDVSSNSVIEYILSPLEPLRKYELNLKCVDKSANLLKQYKPLQLKTKGNPCPPKNFKKEVVTDSSITVQWTPGLDGDCQQTFHIAIFRKKNQEDPGQFDDILETDKRKIRLKTWTGLRPGTNYAITLYAQNEIGKSEEQTLTIRTGGKPCPPKQFEKKVVTDSSITVQWTPGLDGEHQQTFHIAIKNDPGQCDGILQTDKRKIWYKAWTGLQPETKYDITLYAQNEIGKSKEQTLTIWTGDGKPEPPENFEVSSTAETSITTKWTPRFDGGHTQTFHVTVTDVNDDENVYEYKVGKKYVCTCKSLKPGTKYAISLKATNEKGSVDALNSIECRTYGPPEKVTGFKTVRKTNSTITVTWDPGCDGGFDQYFDLVDLKRTKVLIPHIDNTAIKEEHTITIVPEDRTILPENTTILPEDTEIEWQVISVNKKGRAFSDPLKDTLYASTKTAECL